MKKIALVILTIILTVFSIGMLAACNPETVEKIKGTYKMSVDRQ